MSSWEPAWPGRPTGESSLGLRIAVLRAERGWTQQRLADRLGISRVAVSHLETDVNPPGERTVALLAGLFRMEPHELVAGTTYPDAKADRLPLVVNRWTEVEHRLALLEADLWWLDRMGRLDEADRAEVDARLARWDDELTLLGAASVDPAERDQVAAARRRLGDVRHLRP